MNKIGEIHDSRERVVQITVDGGGALAVINHSDGVLILRPSEVAKLVNVLTLALDEGVLAAPPDEPPQSEAPAGETTPGETVAADTPTGNADNPVPPAADDEEEETKSNKKK